MSLPDRFEQKIAYEPNTGCWLWTACVNRQGYGKYGASGDSVLAHFSWERHFGKIIDDKCVLHKCDTPSCVNPAHLFLGTVRDNLADMRRKGRAAVGERHGMAKLTKQQALEIRMSQGSEAQVAAKYGVSRTRVGFIRRGQNWKDEVAA